MFILHYLSRVMCPMSPDTCHLSPGAQKSKIVFKTNTYCLPKCVIFKNISDAIKRREVQFKKMWVEGRKTQTNGHGQTQTDTDRHRQTQKDTDRHRQ